MRGVFCRRPDLTQRNREPTEHRVSIGGVELCYFEWGEADTAQPTVVLAHATGFHARCWDRVVANLDAARHVIAIDQRGHGRSAKIPPFNWESFGGDLARFVAALDLERIVGVGHSMGGHAVVQAAASEQSRFERLLLVDPVIMDPALYASLKGAMGNQRAQDHPTSKRNNLWPSWREMFDRLKGRGSFSVWRSDVLEDYCRWGVLPNPDGAGFVLACPPLVEASIYTGSGGRDIHELFAKITVPVTVLRGEKRTRLEAMDFLASPTWEHLADQFPKGRDVYLPHLTHFIPMQDPELVARFIEGRA
jgi:pimeloyl-ACP methyl ester carboxylesterase